MKVQGSTFREKKRLTAEDAEMPQSSQREKGGPDWAAFRVAAKIA